MKNLVIFLGIIIVVLSGAFVYMSNTVNAPEEAVPAGVEPSKTSKKEQDVQLIEPPLETVSEPPFAGNTKELLGIEPIACADAMRNADVCTEIYQPVCGLVEVQCVTEPCPPLPQTFENPCVACSRGNAVSYTEGECILEVS